MYYDKNWLLHTKKIICERKKLLANKVGFTKDLVDKDSTEDLNDCSCCPT